MISSTKYIGMDVHKEGISIAVMNASGKIIMECVIETKASMILQFIDGLRGDLQATFEEGPSAAWLYDLRVNGTFGQSRRGRQPRRPSFLGGMSRDRRPSLGPKRKPAVALPVLVTGNKPSFSALLQHFRVYVQASG